MARYRSGDKVDVKILMEDIDKKKDIADITWLKSKLQELTTVEFICSD